MARHRLAAAAALGWWWAVGPEAGGRKQEQQPARPANAAGPPRSTQFGQINASELMFAPEIEASVRRFRLKSSGVWPGFDRAALWVRRLFERRGLRPDERRLCWYGHHLERFLRWRGGGEVTEAGTDDMRRFLEHLAVERHISAGTQNQAFSTLVDTTMIYICVHRRASPVEARNAQLRPRMPARSGHTRFRRQGEHATLAPAWVGRGAHGASRWPKVPPHPLQPGTRGPRSKNIALLPFRRVGSDRGRDVRAPRQASHTRARIRVGPSVTALTQNREGVYAYARISYTRAMASPLVAVMCSRRARASTGVNWCRTRRWWLPWTRDQLAPVAARGGQIT